MVGHSLGGVVVSAYGGAGLPVARDRERRPADRARRRSRRRSSRSRRCCAAAAKSSTPRSASSSRCSTVRSPPRSARGSTRSRAPSPMSCSGSGGRCSTPRPKTSTCSRPISSAGIDVPYLSLHGMDPGDDYPDWLTRDRAELDGRRLARDRPLPAPDRARPVRQAPAWRSTRRWQRQPGVRRCFFFGGAFLRRGAAWPSSRCSWTRPALRGRDFGGDCGSAPPSASSSSSSSLARRRRSSGALEARFERGHQVEHLGRRLGLGLGDDLLAGRLLVDELEELLAVLVVVLLRLEVAGERLDELGRHRELALADARRPRPGCRASRGRRSRRRSASSRRTASRRAGGSRRAAPSPGSRRDRPPPSGAGSSPRPAAGTASPPSRRRARSTASRSRSGRSRRGRRSPRSRSCGSPSAPAPRARTSRRRRSGPSRSRSP